MKRQFLLPALFLCLSSVPLHARVNVLEPWSPGVDFYIPRKDWTHGANVRWGVNGTDLFEAEYLLSHRPRADWEIGGALGYVSLDEKGAGGSSGINDLRVAAKHLFSSAVSPAGTRLIGEGGLSLPTGDPDKGIGAGGVGALLGWGIQMPVQSVTGYVHLGVRAYTEGNDTRWGNVFTYVLGTQYELDTEFSLTADLRGFNHGKDKINGMRIPGSRQEVYLAPGVQWHPMDAPAHFLGSLLIGLSNESFDVGLMAGAKF